MVKLNKNYYFLLLGGGEGVGVGGFCVNVFCMKNIFAKGKNLLKENMSVWFFCLLVRYEFVGGWGG